MKPTVYADHRERNSSVLPLLKKEAIVILRNLEVGDYVLSEDVGVERKTAADFVSSIIDGRLFDQVKRLKEAYPKPLVIIEGDPYYLGRVHENAIRGALSHVILDQGVPVYFSRNEADTAKTLALIARREQEENARPVRARPGKKAVTIRDYQRMIVESLPMVGPKLADQLLKKFGSVQKVFNARADELMQVPGLGKKKAEEIRRVITERYDA